MSDPLVRHIVITFCKKKTLIVTILVHSDPWIWNLKSCTSSYRSAPPLPGPAATPASFPSRSATPQPGPCCSKEGKACSCARLPGRRPPACTLPARRTATCLRAARTPACYPHVILLAETPLAFSLLHAGPSGSFSSIASRGATPLSRRCSTASSTSNLLSYCLTGTSSSSSPSRRLPAPWAPTRCLAGTSSSSSSSRRLAGTLRSRSLSCGLAGTLSSRSPSRHLSIISNSTRIPAAGSVLVHQYWFRVLSEKWKGASCCSKPYECILSLTVHCWHKCSSKLRQKVHTYRS
jgi:hypothetical protein